jgi:hypothetical protein
MAQFNLSITLEYGIITAPTFGELVTEVNKRIQNGEGWQPLGGVATLGDNEDWVGVAFYQAVVREKENPKTAITDVVNEIIKARAIHS